MSINLLYNSLEYELFRNDQLIGYHKYKFERKNEDLIINMRDSMKHRGPDGSGVWINNDKNIIFFQEIY